MIFGINTTRHISKFSQITYNNFEISPRHISKFSQITYSNFEISLVVFMPNITPNHSITYTNTIS